MKRILFSFVVCAIFCYSCQKGDLSPIDDNENPVGQGSIFGMVYLNLVTDSGEDLLVSTGTDAILYSDIQHFYVINGQKQLQNHSNLKTPKLLDIIEPHPSAGAYYEKHALAVQLGLFSYGSPIDGQEVTSIIEYNDKYPADTITAIVHVHGTQVQNVGYRELKINGKSIDGKEVVNTIVKISN